MKLISKKNLNKLISADPNQRDYSTEKYYKFIIKYFYLKKIKLAIKLLNKNKYNKMLDIGFGGGIITPELSKQCNQYFGVDVHKNIELVKEICKRLDKIYPSKNKNYKSYSKLIKHVDDRPGHDQRYALNTDKIKKLNWNPKNSFENGINKTIDFYLKKIND